MPTKKTTKKMPAKKAVVKSAPVMEHKCACGEPCRCHCHGGAHFIKHLIVWAIIFALGMVAGKMLPCGHGFKHMPKMHPVFVNGCLDMSSIECPKMQEKLAAADMNGDNCVSVEEYRAVKKEMRKEMREHKGFPGPKGPRGPEPRDMEPQPQPVEE